VVPSKGAYVLPPLNAQLDRAELQHVYDVSRFCGNPRPLCLVERFVRSKMQKPVVFSLLVVNVKGKKDGVMKWD
jgi:hypothetical protein